MQTAHPKVPGPAAEPPYREAYRPQFHFTARQNWLNDPNGLVYFDGEYHLFYQHNPGGIQWGNMSWGHAVSKNLVNWEELPVALVPDATGTIFSGSAAVDSANTTGLNAPLVALYTAAGKPFTQCLAFSKDRGRTWTKYSGNPVLGHIAGENRDPKILWHAPSHQWVMALYLDGDEFGLYGSPNLKSWKELSRLHLPGSTECPELFEIAVRGGPHKWIFHGGNLRYLIGSFDGRVFTPEHGPFIGDYGANFYASQTYNNAPDGRRIQIGWMNGTGPYPGMPFNQQMSFPCDLWLVQTHDGLMLTRWPVKEINTLHKDCCLWSNLTVGDYYPLTKLRGGLYDIHAFFEPSNGSVFGLQIGSEEIVLDTAKKVITCLGKVAPLAMRDGRVDLRVLADRCSVEVFAQGGLVSMTSYLPVSDIPPSDRGVRVFSRTGSVLVSKIEAYELKSAW